MGQGPVRHHQHHDTSIYQYSWIYSRHTFYISPPATKKELYKAVFTDRRYSEKAFNNLQCAMYTHQVATWAEWAGWKQEVPSRLLLAACLNGRQLRPTIDDNRGDWEHQGGKLEQHPPKWRSATSWPQRRQKPNQLTNEQQLKHHFPPQNTASRVCFLLPI